MNNLNDSKELRELIRVLERKLGILEKSEMTCCDVTFAQCHAIIEIGRAKTISLNELAQMLNLESSTLSRTVNNLVNDELVQRELDPEDRRYITIQLTEKGQKIFKTIEEGMGIYFQKITDSIPPNKIKQVLESLELLIDAMGKSNCCNGDC